MCSAVFKSKFGTQMEFVKRVNPRGPSTRSAGTPHEINRFLNFLADNGYKSGGDPRRVHC